MSIHRFSRIASGCERRCSRKAPHYKTHKAIPIAVCGWDDETWKRDHTELGERDHEAALNKLRRYREVSSLSSTHQPRSGAFQLSFEFRRLRPRCAQTYRRVSVAHCWYDHLPVHSRGDT